MRKARYAKKKKKIEEEYQTGKEGEGGEVIKRRKGKSLNGKRGKMQIITIVLCSQILLFYF